MMFEVRQAWVCHFLSAWIWVISIIVQKLGFSLGRQWKQVMCWTQCLYHIKSPVNATYYWDGERKLEREEKNTFIYWLTSQISTMAEIGWGWSVGWELSLGLPLGWWGHTAWTITCCLPSSVLARNGGGAEIQTQVLWCRMQAFQPQGQMSVHALLLFFFISYFWWFVSCVEQSSCWSPNPHSYLMFITSS